MDSWIRLIETLSESGDPSLVQNLTTPGFLLEFFGRWRNIPEQDSFRLGKAILDALGRCNVDLGLYKTNMLLNSDDSLRVFLLHVEQEVAYFARRLIMEETSSGEWILGWKRWTDPKEDEHALLSTSQTVVQKTLTGERSVEFELALMLHGIAIHEVKSTFWLGGHARWAAQIGQKDPSKTG